MKRILVIGSYGQIGSELVPALQNVEGIEVVYATDKKSPQEGNGSNFACFDQLDVLDYNALEKFVKDNNIDTIYHLASLLSATGEKYPQTAWNLNINGLMNVLEVARKNDVKRIVWPSKYSSFWSNNSTRKHT